MLNNLTAKIPLIGDNTDYTTKGLILRKRGDTWQPEMREAVRYRYDDRPNAYKLDTGEEIPAVSLDNVYTMSDGTPFFIVQELEDEQYSPVKLDFDKDKIQASVLNNKDQRLNFWLDHLKESQEKYGPAGLIREHINIILVVVTALAVAIIMYSAGDFSDGGRQLSDGIAVLRELNENAEVIAEQVQEGGNLEEPPGGN